MRIEKSRYSEYEYNVFIPGHMRDEVEEWLTLTFGPGSNNKRSVWRKHQFTNLYTVKYEHNMALFKLRWVQ